MLINSKINCGRQRLLCQKAVTILCSPLELPTYMAQIITMPEKANLAFLVPDQTLFFAVRKNDVTILEQEGNKLSFNGLWMVCSSRILALCSFWRAWVITTLISQRRWPSCLLWMVVGSSHTIDWGKRPFSMVIQVSWVASHRHIQFQNAEPAVLWASRHNEPKYR